MQHQITSKNKKKYNNKNKHRSSKNTKKKQPKSSSNNKNDRKNNVNTENTNNNNNDDVGAISEEGIPELLPDDEAQYIGCFISEDSFADKIYEGGSTGASYNLALHNAKVSGKRFFAIARGQGDGHSFAFGRIDPKGRQARGGGCERTCIDTPDKVCGCIDGDCTSPKPKGEEHNRRWAVYALLAP